MSGRAPSFDPAILAQSFRTAAGELGLADAAWRFVAELDSVGGAALVEAVRNQLGTTYPVLDAVCGQHLAGNRPNLDAARIAECCGPLKRLLVVGVEARWLDALFAVLPSSLEIAIVPSASFAGDLSRMLSNLRAGVSMVGLDRFQRYAGSHSGMLTFVYGATDASAFVVPEWVRCQGPDVRAQFRSFLGWNLLGTPPEVYPRWLIEVSRDLFTDMVRA